jgi:ATP-dependent DNA helicase RecG
MIIHRDYRSSADSIVKIFDNKMEFFNPGRLPDSITIEDLLSNTYRSTPRNKQIADFCKDMGLIEKYGSGIRRIFSSFEQEKLPEPQFCNISDGFMVTVFCENIDIKLGDKLGGKLGDKQILILDSIKKTLT